MMRCHLLHPLMRLALLVVAQLLTLATVALQVILVVKAHLITWFTAFVGEIGSMSFLSTMLQTLGMSPRYRTTRSYPYPVLTVLYKYFTKTSHKQTKYGYNKCGVPLCITGAKKGLVVSKRLTEAHFWLIVT